MHNLVVLSILLLHINAISIYADDSDPCIQIENQINLCYANLESNKLEQAELALAKTKRFAKSLTKCDNELKVSLSNAYFKTGMLAMKEYTAVMAPDREWKDMQAFESQRALKLHPVIRNLNKAIDFGTPGLAIDAQIAIGKSMLETANAFLLIPLAFTDNESIAQRIRKLYEYDMYCDRAKEKFLKTYNLAVQIDSTNENAKLSADLIVKTAYVKGKLYNLVSQLFSRALVPKKLDDGKESPYAAEIREKSKNWKLKAIKSYENALVEVKTYRLGESQWADSAKVQISESSNTQIDSLISDKE